MIGAGCGRTGTSSLREALKILGHNPYHMEECVRNDHLDSGCARAAATARRRRRPAKHDAARIFPRRPRRRARAPAPGRQGRPVDAQRRRLGAVGPRDNLAPQFLEKHCLSFVAREARQDASAVPQRLRRRRAVARRRRRAKRARARGRSVERCPPPIARPPRDDGWAPLWFSASPPDAPYPPQRRRELRAHSPLRACSGACCRWLVVAAGGCSVVEVSVFSRPARNLP